jgi:hypothetical protein
LGEVGENSVLSAQFCCELKNFLKNKDFFILFYFIKDRSFSQYLGPQQMPTAVNGLREKSFLGE